MDESFSLDDKSEFNIALACLIIVNAILNLTVLCTKKNHLYEFFNVLLLLDQY